jgi:hypothetical protein
LDLFHKMDLLPEWNGMPTSLAESSIFPDGKPR